MFNSIHFNSKINQLDHDDDHDDDHDGIIFLLYSVNLFINATTRHTNFSQFQVNYKFIFKSHQI